jgi:hypothetical protein
VSAAHDPQSQRVDASPLRDETVRDFVERQRLGFVATVRPDGTPDLAPQGTLAIWDDETLVFADLAAHDTVRHLLENPACTIGVVDPIARQGYRFQGSARLLLSGPTFDRLLDFYRSRGVHEAIHHMVLVQVQRSDPFETPAVDLGWSLDELRERWEAFEASGKLPPGAVGPGV